MGYGESLAYWSAEGYSGGDLHSIVGSGVLPDGSEEEDDEQDEAEEE